MKVILLFLDGVGIGVENWDINPFFRADLSYLKYILGGTLPHSKRLSVNSKYANFKALDATLGVEGLPQSGTGQVALFTGINGAKKIGRHFGPHPPVSLLNVLERYNLFAKLLKMGKTVCFANAFPHQFFEYAESPKAKLSVSTLICRMSGVKLYDGDFLENNTAVSADITRERWKELGYERIFPIRSQSAGMHLAEISKKFDFTLFEYWLPDFAGHSQNMNEAVEVLERFSDFLQGVVEQLFKTDTCILLISDHGNIEDLSVKTHTRNPVPFLSIRNNNLKIESNMHSIIQLTAVIKKIISTST